MIDASNDRSNRTEFVNVVLYLCVIVPPGSSYDILRNFISLEPEEQRVNDDEQVTSEDFFAPYDAPSSVIEHKSDDELGYEEIDEENEIGLANFKTTELSITALPNLEKPQGDIGGLSSSSTVTPVSAAGRRPGTAGSKQTVKKCRFVPVVYSGNTIVKLGEICFQVPASLESSSSTGS